MNFRAKIMSSAAGGIVALMSPAYAELAANSGSSASALPSNPAVSPTEVDNGEGEILVTARRVSESVQKVPLSITVLGSDELRRQQVKAVEDLQFSSPALTLSSGLSRSAIGYNIRGQGASRGGALPGVQPYFNDVPLANGTFQLYDLSSVQILKGPQGTLFGRNTTGGAVIFTSERPKDTFGGYFQGSFGNLDYVDAQGALNIPLVGDKLSLRVAGDRVRRRGFTQDLTHRRDLDDQHIDSWRMSLVVRPTESIESLFVYDGVRVRQNGSAAIISGFIPGAASRYPGFLAAAAAQQRLGPRQRYVDASLFDHRDQMGIQNTTSLKLSDAITIKNIIAYRNQRVNTAYDQDGTALTIANTTSDYGGLNQADNHTVSEELQVLGKAFNNRVDWIVGGYADQTKSDNPEASTSRLLGTIYRTVITQQNDTTKAVFGQANIGLPEVVEGLRATAGLRYTWDKRSIVSQTINLATPVPTPGALLQGKAKFDAPSWTLGFDWQATKNLLLYFANRRGYKSGGFNSLAANAGQASIYQPETLTDFEIGVKADYQIGDMRGRVNLAVFTGNYKDIQRTILATASTTATINAAAARIRGFELEAMIRPARRLELSAFWSFVDARYQSFTNPFNGQDLTGTFFAFTPKHKINVTAKYDFPNIGTLGHPSASITYYHQSKVAYSDENLNFAPAFGAGYSTVNMNIEIENFGGSPIDLSFFGRNILNRTYVSAAGLINPGIYGLSTLLYGEPRTYGVTGRIAF